MKKLQAAKMKSRIHLKIDSEKKTLIEINSEIDYKPNVEVYFNEVAASKNIAKANMVDNSINARKFVLKEQIYNISNILQRVTSLMQQLGNNNDKKLVHQNTIHNEDLHHYIVPRGYQKFMDFDKKINTFASASAFPNDELALEKQRLSLELKIFLEYAKSIQNSLSWLIRLLELKWQQLHNDFDDTSRLSLFSLQKQAEFLLETLIENNRRQRKESKKYQYLPTDRSESNGQTIKREKVIISRQRKNRKGKKKANVKKIIDNQAVLMTESSILVSPKSSKNRNKILNATEIKIEEATTLKNLYKNKTDETTSVNKEIKDFEGVRNETQKINENRTSDQIVYKPETRILSYPIVLKNITDHFKNKNFAAIKINSVNSEFIINKTAVGNNSITNIFLPKIKNINQEMFSKFKGTSHGKSIKTENHKNLFGQLKNNSTILSGKNMTDTLKETDTQKRVRMEVLLHKSLKESTTNIPDTEVLMLSNKSENQHVSGEKVADNYYYSHAKVGTNIDRTSTIDELLEAVNDVLPMEKSVEILPMRLKMISGIS